MGFFNACMTTPDPAANAPEHLSQQDIHIWLSQPASIVDPALLKAYLALLDREEYDRWARIKIPRVQHEYLIAHALLRLTLSRYAPLPPTAWRFSRNAYGRPEVANPEQLSLRFNISHTKGLVACAVTREQAIGVDVETLERSNRLLDIADRYFSPQECADLQRLPDPQQHAGFFDYWTLKESFIKAKGMGLALALDSFGFQLRAGPGRKTIGLTVTDALQDTPAHWAFWLYQLGPNHKLALCCENPAQIPFPSAIRPRIRPFLPTAHTHAMTIELLGTSHHAETLA